MIQGPKLIDMLTSLYNQQDRITQECFDSSPNFKFLLNKAFEEEINKTGLVIPCDLVLLDGLYASPEDRLSIDGSSGQRRLRSKSKNSE